MPCDVMGCDSSECTVQCMSFKCKARFWRDNPRSLGVSYRGGRDFFHDHTIKETNDENLRIARANGINPEPVVPPNQVPVSSLGAL